MHKPSDSSPFTKLAFTQSSHRNTPYASCFTHHTIYIYTTLEASPELCTVNDAGRNILRHPSNFLLLDVRASPYFWFLPVNLQKSESIRLYCLQQTALNGRPLLCQGLDEDAPKPSRLSYFLGGNTGFVSQTRKPTVPTNIFLEFFSAHPVNAIIVPKINPRPLPQPVTQYPLTTLAFSAVYSKSNKP